jgi:hypothetical protein
MRSAPSAQPSVSYNYSNFELQPQTARTSPLSPRGRDGRESASEGNPVTVRQLLQASVTARRTRNTHTHTHTLTHSLSLEKRMPKRAVRATKEAGDYAQAGVSPQSARKDHSLPTVKTDAKRQ